MSSTVGLTEPGSYECLININVENMKIAQKAPGHLWTCCLILPGQVIAKELFVHSKIWKVKTLLTN